MPTFTETFPQGKSRTQTMFATNNNNNNTNANVYSAVIMAQPLREFTRFTWLNIARAPAGCRPLDQADLLEPMDPPVGSYRNYIHHRHLLLLS